MGKAENAVMIIIMFGLNGLGSAIMPCDDTAATQPPLPASEWTAEAKHLTAQMNRGEADWTAHSDHIAMPWVMVKRFLHGQKVGHEADRFGRIRYKGRGIRPARYVDYIRSYSSPLKVSKSRRQRETQALPWGPLTGRLARFSVHWLVIMANVERFGRGEIPDICPEATHWGGWGDAKRGRMRKVKCSEPTANTFYKVAPSE